MKWPQALGTPSLGCGLGAREQYGWAWELVYAAGDLVVFF